MRLNKNKDSEKEKENLKKTVSDLENKIKKQENDKQFIQFEFEKEKTKWSIEKDRLQQNNNDILDKLNSI